MTTAYDGGIQASRSATQICGRQWTRSVHDAFSSVRSPCERGEQVAARRSIALVVRQENNGEAAYIVTPAESRYARTVEAVLPCRSFSSPVW